MMIFSVVIEKVFYSRKTVQQFVFNRINGLWMMTSICYKSMYQNNNASFLKFYAATVISSISSILPARKSSNVFKPVVA